MLFWSYFDKKKKKTGKLYVCAKWSVHKAGTYLQFL